MMIAERAESRLNNFNVLRLIAALMVLVSHCFALTRRPEPFATFTGQTFGELGVSIFFAISGFLVAKSWLDDPRLIRFVVKRASRLLPGLIVAVLLTGLVLGPLTSTLSPFLYLTNIEVYRYIVENSVLDTVNGRLPGVFEHNVYPAAVNGSLWTLPVESLAYVGTAMLGLLGALRLRQRASLALASFALLLLLSTLWATVKGLQVTGSVGGNLGLLFYLGALFNAGVLLCVTRERIVLRWDMAAVLSIIWIASFGTVWVRTVAILAIPYLVLMLAYRTPLSLSAATRPGDVSYGIYIYAFPAQQLAARAWGPSLEPGVMLALVAVPVYGLAWLSWRLVESPALRFRRRVMSHSSSLAAPT